MAEAAKWYVVHTYSGYENTVKVTIEKTVQSRGLQDSILAISIPMETVTAVTEAGARQHLACNQKRSRSRWLRRRVCRGSHSPHR